MAGKNTLIKSFFNDQGLDLSSSDLTRPKEFASGLLNEDYRKTGAMNKRKGYQGKFDNIGGNGLSIFSNVNKTTGAIIQEMVTLDDNLHRLSDQTFTITYSGSDVARMNMFLDIATNTFHFSLIDNEVEVLDFDMGVGINEVSVITLSSLKTQVDAVTNFTSVISGSVALPASFINITRDITVISTGTAIKYVQFNQINSPSSAPLATFHSKRNGLEFQNASFVNLSNVLYVSTGHNELHKYDGQTFYRAGVPKGTKLVTVDAGAGNITNSATNYISTVVQIDNKQNVIEGIPSDPSINLNLSSKLVDITVTNILANSGFNTNCAVVNGAQSTINQITVDDSSSGDHTMKVGDTAYFFDSVENDFITRNVDSITSTTITVAGSAVTVADNAIISNNLRIAIFRNIAAGTSQFLLVELPNDSFNATQVHRDNIAASGLGSEFIAPVKFHGLPPKGKYITSFRSLLIVGGDLENINTVYYSDIDGPEFFPPGDQSFLVETHRGDKVTGIATNSNALFVFKGKSVHALTGDIVADSFRVDEISSGDIGCSSHHTIAEVKGKLIFLGEKGVFGLTIGNNKAEEISIKIQTIFETANSDFNLTKAVAVNWFEKNKYILFLPVEATSAGNDEYTDLTDSRILVFDFQRKAWLEWDNLDFMGGAVIFNSALYFSERRLDTVSNLVESFTYKIQDTGDTYDYADHEKSISWEHKTNWESMGDPDVFKKFTRLKVHSIDASVNDFESDNFTISVEIQTNYNDAPTSKFDLNYGNNTLGWGDFSWSDESWGSLRDIERKSKLKVTKNRSIRIIYTNNTLHENVLISGWTLEANLPYKERIKE